MQPRHRRSPPGDRMRGAARALCLVAVRGRRLALSAVLGTALSLAACHAESLTEGPLPLGAWGGLQGTLTIYADSATVDLPCAAGRIPAQLAPAEDGSFEAAGFYAVQAGPIGINGLVWRPALYSGRRDGDRIELWITLADATRIGPFVFERGIVKMFPRCL